MMEIKGDPKEIADFVMQLQSQQSVETTIKINGEEIFSKVKDRNKRFYKRHNNSAFSD